MADKCVCGSQYHQPVDCPVCKGKGRTGGGLMSSPQECRHCNGTGKKCPKGNK